MQQRTSCLTLITFAVCDIRLATTLDMMLEPYLCCWTIQDGMINIISRDESQTISRQGIAVVDCADLMSTG